MTKMLGLVTLKAPVRESLRGGKRHGVQDLPAGLSAFWDEERRLHE